MGVDHIINQSICWAVNTDSLIVSHNKITIVFLSEIICIRVKDWICRLGYAIVCTWGLLLRHVDGPLDFDLIIPLKKSTINFQYPCGPSNPSTHKIPQWTTFQGIYNLHCLPLKYWEMITKHDLIQNC